MKIKAKPKKQISDARQIRNHALLKMSDAEIDTWMDNNVTNLESAKDAMAIIAKLLKRVTQAMADEQVED